MPANDVDFTALDELAALLQAAGVRSVSTDPPAVNLPGVLLQVTGVGQEVMDGCTILLDVVCLVPDTEVPRALAGLQVLYNTVRPVLEGLGGPAGDTRATRYTLTASGPSYPALAVPLALLTTPSPE